MRVQVPLPPHNLSYTQLFHSSLPFFNFVAKQKNGGSSLAVKLKILHAHLLHILSIKFTRKNAKIRIKKFIKSYCSTFNAKRSKFLYTLIYYTSSVLNNIEMRFFLLS